MDNNRNWKKISSRFATDNRVKMWAVKTNSFRCLLWQEVCLYSLEGWLLALSKKEREFLLKSRVPVYVIVSDFLKSGYTKLGWDYISAIC